MAKYIDAERLRAEIERRMNAYAGDSLSLACTTAIDGFEPVLEIIDSLQQEQPEVDIEKEIERWWGEEYMKNSEGLPILPIVQGIARNFAQWGAEHLADARKTSPKDLEEAAWDCVLDNIDVNNPVLLPKYKELLTYLFIAGAKWQKEQMVMGAVEGHIVSRNDGWNSIELPSTFFGELSKNYKHGDKVRIIIIKEDER